MSKAKSLLAEAIAKRVQTNQVIGLGSGTTAEVVLEAICKRVKAEKLHLRAVATSLRIAMLAQDAGIDVLALTGDFELDWAFDGADEVDPDFNMIKGLGAAMLVEKLVACRTKKLVIAVTEEKLVQTLGEKFPIPVAVLPDAVGFVRNALVQLGAEEIVLRQGQGKYGPVFTEQGHVILDARFSAIAPVLEKEIKSIPGVIESGLFVGYAHEVLVARANGVFCRDKGGKETSVE